ncbi:DUF1604-domain-containing protein [Trichodelitschia bisporula]|uniref:DUF1604-domain-containing protein n=1 Tax=Trichodelitschia bisporula TaxID=703511 RepID=A0A6G1HYI1_9PEZI|nr:DUF1604-domain-containing protein [Trichodelitschia bisporula]
MAFKRSRATFEADLQAQQSPYVVYGTPLPPLDPDVRDDGSFVPVWKQDARDEWGRKRFHGAFTGGWSAGHFNTVGSKEGFQPASFVSSRSKRAAVDQNAAKPEDFMDEEDLAEAEEARKLQTSSEFSGLGSTAEETARRDAFIDLVRPGGETIGTKLLQRMGWRPGQGVGPKVRRKAHLEDGENGEDGETHLFAPENSSMISFVKKNDTKGLGYAGELSLTQRVTANDDDEALEFSKARAKPQKKKSAFGVGVLNDTGSDDEDPYEIGPKISYNRTIGGDKKKKRPLGPSKAVPNPSLLLKPVFVSKKDLVRRTAPGFRKCHDGRFPLDGFILSTKPLDLVSEPKYPPPEIPPDWTPNKASSSASAKPFQSTAEAAKASTLDPTSRAALLGESPLPGKSVFDYLTPAARARLASASGRADLPSAHGEEPPEAFRKSDKEKAYTLRGQVPHLDKDVAQAALARGAAGWMPYADDLPKRARYRSFLEVVAEVRTGLPERATGASAEDWRREMSEFAQAAMVFRPVSGMMASRFTSAQRTFEGSRADEGGEELVRKPEKKEDPAVEAARMGMFGPLTRSVARFYPTRLLCKRFNVPPPKEVGDEGGASGDVAEVVSKEALERMMRDARNFRGKDGGMMSREEMGIAKDEALPVWEVVDTERNEAIEAERPGEDLFRAIFGDDD